jgi:hypothetical protein
MGVISSPLLLVFFLSFSRMEAYCFFYPSIDTRYAPGFSEKRFATLKVGDAAQRVEAILGPPLVSTDVTGGAAVWLYTSDGKCQWGDFAWLYRAVKIDNGVVAEIVSRVMYD